MIFKSKVASFVTLLALGLFVIAEQPARAQILYGSIVGKVTDPSSAAISGAKITITNKVTGFTREVSTDSDGNYEIPNVPTGSYEVKTNAPGFSAAVRSDVPVTINNISRVDVSLQLGAVTETVSVTGEAQLLQTDRAEVRQEVNSTELSNLPAPPGRNYQQIFRALPGFSPPENAHSIPTNRPAGTMFPGNAVRLAPRLSPVSGS